MVHEREPRVDAFIRQTLDAGEPTPFVVIDLEAVQQAYRGFVARFPAVAPYYAMKANPEPAILTLLRDAGIGFDVASAGEVRALSRLGVAPERLIFANPVKGPRELTAAREAGVHLTTADCLEELEKLDAFARRTGHRFAVLVRLWVPNFGSLIDLSSKFGAVSSAVRQMFATARDAELALDLRGLAFHVGSQCINPANYTKAFELALGEIASLRAGGHPIDILDIGGGFPAEYAHTVSYVDDVERAIAEALEDVPEDLTVIAEPGRTFVAGAATLVTRIIGRTRRQGRRWYFVDDSIYNTFSGKVYDLMDYRVYPFARDAHPAADVVVAGCSCDGRDVISRQSALPDDLAVGDALLVPNVGAYTTVSASNFNGFDLARRFCLPPLAEPAPRSR